MKLKNQHRTGLLPEHRTVKPPVHDVRATIPVIEALRASGNGIEPIGTASAPLYRVTLTGTVPPGIVARCDGEGHTVLRLDVEPPYPRELTVWCEQAAWLPCPECGAALVWYEACYVPGYRVCARPPHHHWLIR